MTPRSINGRILLGIILCGLGMSVISSWLTYALFLQNLDRELDHSLSDKLRFLRASCVQQGDEVVMNRSLQIWHQVHDPDDPEYFMIQIENGDTLLQSETVKDWKKAKQWPEPHTHSRDPFFQTIELPAGGTGRAGWQIFYPEKESGSLAQPIPVRLFVAHDRDRAESALANLRGFLFLANGGALLLILGAVSLIVWLNLRPLRQLTEQIDSIALGDPESRFSLENPPFDLVPVVARLNALMDRVTATLEHERQFSANAAHELRNPLAGIRSQIEAELNRERSAEDYRGTLRTVLEVERRLEGVVENLLVLNRLQSGKIATESEPVDLAHLLRREWKAVFDAAETKDLTMHWEIAKSASKLDSSPTLLGMVVRNLFDNAVTYAPTGSRIRVELEEAEKNQMCLRVINANSGLSAEECQQAQDRFWRKSPSREGDHVHGGLGLSLITAVIEVLEGKFVFTVSETGDEVRAEILLRR